MIKLSNYILALGTFLLSNYAFSQTTYPILNLTISGDSPISIVFTSEIQKITNANKSIGIKRSASNDKVLQFSVNTHNFQPSRVEILTSNGDVHLFNLVYCKNYMNSGVDYTQLFDKTSLKNRPDIFPNKSSLVLKEIIK